MNCNGVINISLGYQIYRILFRLGHLEVLTWFFLTILMILVMSSFLLHCCYVYNFKNHYWKLYI